MSRSTQLCPRCGESVSEPVTERGLCPACHAETVELVDVPARIEVYHCGQCDSIAVDDDWRDEPRDPVEVAIEVVTEQVRIHRSIDDVEWSIRSVPIDDDHRRLAIRFNLVIDDHEFEIERDTTVAIERTTCPRCSRIAGDEYGGIVQVRASDRVPTDEERRRARTVVAEVLDDRVDRGDRESFLTDVVERDAGIDFRLSTPRLSDQVARAIRTELGGDIDTSRTLVTTDGDGQDVYRVTFSIRLPRHRPGDVIELEAGAGLVEAAGEMLTIRDLTTGERLKREPTAVDPPVTTAAEAKEATVVAPLDENAVQLIHPTTNEAVTVAQYPGVELTGDTVPVIEVNGRLYLLARDGR